MIVDEKSALIVAEFIKNSDFVRERFELLIEERCLDPADLESLSKVHVYGMALKALSTREALSLTKCCRFILSSDVRRKEFISYVQGKYGKLPILIKELKDEDHVVYFAMKGLGVDPARYFPYHFAHVTESSSEVG